MNERIEKLAKKSGLLGRKFMFGQYYTDELTDEQKKFAELLVKECADIALKSGNIANKSIHAKVEADRIYHKIQEHFGVEQ